MVKGISKQVVLVKPQGETAFEQAIFILRPRKKEYSEKHIRNEARRIIAEKTDLSGGNSKLFGK